MNKLLDLDSFIKKLTQREKSLLANDIANNKQLLDNLITGKNVLVIGGAGTIGASFVRALLKYGHPTQLVVVDINENGLTELVRDVRSRTRYNIPNSFLTYPINYADPVFNKVFHKYGKFDIVANFAAHKHVRSEKDEFSIEAMFRNNVLQAKKLLDLLSDAPPNNFFCVSTDKAANPVNVMGATKKLMEDVIMAYSDHINISTARFANVAFSNGSLPFGFIERLMKQQPLSAPKNVRRFFVSPEESGEICMMACLLGRSGDIFFPKLDADNDMRTFTYIADKLLAELGLQPFYCESEEQARQMALALKADSATYPVYYFDSDTSGEKPYEEFYTDSERINWNDFQMLGVIKGTQKKTVKEINTLFEKFETFFSKKDIDKKAIVAILKDYLPNFEHIEKGKSLDQRM